MINPSCKQVGQQGQSQYQWDISQISPGVKQQAAKNSNDEFYPLWGEIIDGDKYGKKKKKKDGRIKIHKIWPTLIDDERWKQHVGGFAHGLEL